MDVISLLREFGVPTVFLGFTLYAVYQALMFISIRIIVPLQEKHFEFLTELERLLRQLAQNQAQLVADLRRLGETVEALEARISAWERDRS